MSRTILVRFKLEQPRAQPGSKTAPPQLDADRMLAAVEERLTDAVQGKYGDVDVTVTLAGVNEIRVSGSWTQKATDVRPEVAAMLEQVLENLDTTEYLST